jgi:hypothetical protein
MRWILRIENLRKKLETTLQKSPATKSASPNRHRNRDGKMLQRRNALQGVTE